MDKLVLFIVSCFLPQASQVLSFLDCSSSNEIFGFRLRLIKKTPELSLLFFSYIFTQVKYGLTFDL